MKAKKERKGILILRLLEGKVCQLSYLPLFSGKSERKVMVDIFSLLLFSLSYCCTQQQNSLGIGMKSLT